MRPRVVKGKRILLVDDEPLIRSACRMLLELDDHEVTEADDGVAALKIFKPDEFDLVITDFRMPRMDGGQLTHRLKEVAPAKPVIIVTAWPQDVKSAPTPPDLVVTKPYTLNDLQVAIAKLAS